MVIKPLGDAALIAYMPNEAAAVALAAAVRALAPAWLEDVVPAYATVGVFFNADMATLKGVQEAITQTALTAKMETNMAPTTHVIPVNYARGEDLEYVANYTKLTVDEVIRLHASTEYTVHAIGFVPGFPYLGYLPDALCGVPRLASPRVRVEPGSVGLTGRQTGIYPLARPGGWPLIGRTDFKLVDVAAGYFPLKVGDKIRFEKS